MSNLSRRKFLITSLLTGSATASSGLLQSCAPDFAAIDAALQSGEPEEPAAVENATVGSEEASEEASEGAAGDSIATSDETAAKDAEKGTIKVGLLHSLSGTMALSEAPLLDAELLAIEEINASGGLLGQQLVPIKEDGASDWPTFAEKAEKLIDKQAVAVIFGGLTSFSRKAMLPVVSAKNRLLWYPGAYEGQECSENVFYAGMTANQQIAPAVSWMIGNRGKSFFLVSSNDRTMHEIAKAQLKDYGGKVAGEAYVPLVNGTNVDMAPVIEDIKNALPDGGIVFNGLVGNHNRAFFRGLKSAGLTSEKYLVISTRLAEEEVFQIGSTLLEGHYAAWSYFQTIESPENKTFVEKFQRRYGQDRVIDAPMASAYTMVYLWAQAVASAQSVKTEAVRQAAYGQTFKGPEGLVTIQPNHHTTHKARIGRVLDNGQFEILYEGDAAIDPTPWSQSLPSSKGFSCDWSDPDKGGKYSIKAAAEEVD